MAPTFAERTLRRPVLWHRRDARCEHVPLLHR